MTKHEIIVGNIGTVKSGCTVKEAEEAFKEYRDQSKNNYGRAAGESVTWLRDGEIFKEYIGSNTDND